MNQEKTQRRRSHQLRALLSKRNIDVYIESFILIARLRSSPSNRNQPSKPEIALQKQPKDKAPQKESKDSALQRDSKENAKRKDSKLTAALKTTWNIIKKPFKF